MHCNLRYCKSNGCGTRQNGLNNRHALRTKGLFFLLLRRLLEGTALCALAGAAFSPIHLLTLLLLELLQLLPHHRPKERFAETKRTRTAETRPRRAASSPISTPTLRPSLSVRILFLCATGLVQQCKDAKERVTQLATTKRKNTQQRERQNYKKRDTITPYN